MFNIYVKTVNDKVLTFKGLQLYKVEDGFVVFTDNYTGKVKRFAVSNCEIEEIQ
jgi:hypothetical protein